MGNEVTVFVNLIICDRQYGMSTIRDNRSNYRLAWKKKSETTWNNVVPDISIGINWHHRDPYLTAVRMLSMVIK